MSPDQRDDDRRITYFAATHTRGKREIFGIRAVDRGKHMYVIGKTGMGKSTMLENLAIQDIQHGEGMAFIDPHGSTAEKLLDFVPHDRINDVVYFAPFDTDYPIGFNVMEDVGYDKRHLVVSGLMGALKRIWVDAWSARMEYILQNTLLALLEYPGSTLLDVNRMLTNKTFRDDVIGNIKDPIVRAFWVEEFAGYTDRYTQEATPAIQNKIGQFVANPLIRNIVGQSKSSFDIRRLMDEKKILIVNLSKGRMGETNASLLGSMLTVKIYLAAMSRADEPPARMAKLPRFYFYVDEFQSMMNEAFADILSESRKYKLALTLANQYIEQMDEKVRDAVFGNIGTLACFRVGPFDAEVLKTVFEPTFTAEDLIGLGLGQIYLTLMIDGVGSPPFSAETIPPIETPNITYREDVIVRSRAMYGKTRTAIEQSVMDRQQQFIPPPKASKGKPGDKPRAVFTPAQPQSSPLQRMRESASSAPEAGAQYAPRAPYREHYERSAPPAQAASARPRTEGVYVAPTPHTSQPVRQMSGQQSKPGDSRSSLRAAIEAARAQAQGKTQDSGDYAAETFSPLPPVVRVGKTAAAASSQTFDRRSFQPKPELKTQPQPKPKSPLELLRERETLRQRVSAAPQPKPNIPREDAIRDTPQPPAGDTQSNDTGEISPETLKRVIDGDNRGHEET